MAHRHNLILKDSQDSEGSHEMTHKYFSHYKTLKTAMKWHPDIISYQKTVRKVKTVVK